MEAIAAKVEKEKKPWSRNEVKIGAKDWYSYAATIKGRLTFGPVTVLARGTERCQKASSAMIHLTHTAPVEYVTKGTRTKITTEDGVAFVPVIVGTVTKLEGEE